jgi:hypothetical protein
MEANVMGKIISGGLIGQTKPSTPVKVGHNITERTLQGEEISRPAEKLLGYLGNTGTQLLTAGLGGPSNVVQTAGDIGTAGYNLLTGKNAQFPEVPGTTKQIRKAAEPYLSKEALNPEGLIQKGLDLTTKNWPMLLLGGAPFAQKVGADLASSFASTAAKDAGLGIAGEITAGILGSAGFNKLSHRLKNIDDPNKLINMAKTAENEYWKEAEELGKPISHSGAALSDKITDLVDKINKNIDLSPAEKSDLIEKAKLLGSDIVDGQVNAAQISERISQMNNLIRETPYQMKALRRYLTKMRSALFDTAEDIGKSNKSWYKKWTEARDISNAVHYQSSLADMFDRYPEISKVVTHPIVKKILGFVGGGVGGLGAGAGALASAGAGVVGALGTSGWKKAEQIWGFVGKPVTRGLLRKSAKYVVQENAKGLAKVYSQLNREAEKYEKENPKLFKPSGKGKIISGGLKK